MFGRVFNGMSHRGGAMLRVAVGLLACLVAFGACAVTGGGTGGSTTAEARRPRRQSRAPRTPPPPRSPTPPAPTSPERSPRRRERRPRRWEPSATSSIRSASPMRAPSATIRYSASPPSRQTPRISPSPSCRSCLSQEEYNPYIVDTTTHAVTRVMLGESDPRRQLRYRAAALRLGRHPHAHHLRQSAAGRRASGGPSYSYDINTKALTPLKGVDGAIEGVVRCGVLFYSTLGKFSGLGDVNHTQVATISINRYDLGSEQRHRRAYQHRQSLDLRWRRGRDRLTPGGTPRRMAATSSTRKRRSPLGRRSPRPGSPPTPTAAAPSPSCRN